MAKRKATRAIKQAAKGRRKAAPKRSVKRPKATRRAAKSARKARAKTPVRKSAKASPARPAKAAARSKKTAGKTAQAAPRRTARTKLPRLDRVRRTLEETVQTPPSSLDMDRHGSAARTGRAELANSIEEHGGISPTITGGDVDADWENAYFSGDEAPGGDNPTPDQEVVDDIGKALGVEYHDNEELRAADKVVERDKHRWELDPASSEDYKERK